MIHRAILGSTERFLGILIEHLGGAFPFWLAPEQMIILPISEKHFDYANEVVSKLKEVNLRVELDDRNETLGAKIRSTQEMEIPYMLILGDKEKDANTVAIRKRSGGDLGSKSVEEFIEYYEGVFNS